MNVNDLIDSFEKEELIINLLQKFTNIFSDLLNF